MTFLYLKSNWRNYLEFIPVEKIYFYGNTNYQKILLAHNREFKDFLVINGKIQSAEIDEHIYHEALVHPAMVLHPNPDKVLVIGGGEGCVVREIIKYRPTKIHWVDIDEKLVILCRKYLKYSLKKKPLNVEYFPEDGYNFVRRTQEKYDIIFIDVTDPDENSSKLYSSNFVRFARRRLQRDGILVMLAWERKEDKWIKRADYLKEYFQEVTYYSVFVPSFTTKVVFAFASNNISYLEKDPDEINKKLEEIPTRYYNGNIHYAMSFSYYS